MRTVFTIYWSRTKTRVNQKLNAITKGAFTFLVYASLSACATVTEKVSYRSVADNVLVFDRSKKVSVSPRNGDDLFERNLADTVQAVLGGDGIKVGGSSNYDYILQVGTASETTSETVYKKVFSSSYSTVSVAGKLGNASTNTVTSVPIQQRETYRAISLTLWDAQDTTQRLPIIWKGVVVGRADAIDGREADAIRQLIARIGIASSGETTLVADKVHHDAAAEKPYDNKTTSTPPADADYFSVVGTQINESVRTYNGKSFQNYVKTRAVMTKRFNGYIQQEALEKYPSPKSEGASYMLGLGSFSIRADGLYTADSSDIRELDEGRVQKVLSLPIRLGEVNAVEVLRGASITYTAIRREAVTVPASRFDNCVVIEQETRLQGESSVEHNWFCKGVGWVKNTNPKNSATSVLTKHFTVE